MSKILTLPGELIDNRSTYLHTSVHNFNKTVQDASLISVLEKKADQAERAAIKEIKRLMARAEESEASFVSTMVSEGIYEGENGNKRTVLAFFQKIVSEEYHSPKIVGAIDRTKGQYKRTSSDDRLKQMNYKDLVKEIDNLLNELNKGVKYEKRFSQSLAQSQYQKSIQMLKKFRQDYASKAYNQKIYDKQGVAAIEMGRLLEPALVALVDEKIKKTSENINAINIGKKKAGKTLADMQIQKSGGKIPNFGVDIKSNPYLYKNYRTYKLEDIFDKSTAKSDLNILRYISYNFFNFQGSFGNTGVFTKIYRLLRRIYFFYLVAFNLSPSGAGADIAKDTKEAIIMTPQRAFYYTDFFEELIRQIKAGMPLSKIGKISFETPRHSAYTGKQKGSKIANYSSTRNKHYKAKLKAIGKQNTNSIAAGYRTISNSSEVKSLKEDILNGIKDKSKVRLATQINVRKL